LKLLLLHLLPLLLLHLLLMHLLPQLLLLLLLLPQLLLLTLRSNLLLEEKKPLKSGFFIGSVFLLGAYLAICSVSKVKSCKPAAEFSGLPSAF
jgi:hypothetical protein